MIAQKLRNNTYLVPFIAILTLGFSKKLTLGEGMLLDSFHNGEFLASFVQNSFGSDSPVYTIHGAVDWLPAELASYLRPVHHIFGVTVLIYQVAALLSTIFFMRICLNLARNSDNRISIVTFSGFLGFLAIDHRDLGILLILLTISEFWNRKLTLRTAILVGCIGYFGSFWYYTRGLVGLAILGLFILFKHRSQVVTFLSTFAMLLLVIPYFSPSFGLSFTFRNILKIQESSPEWSHNKPLSDDRLLQLILLIFIASAFMALFHIYFNFKDRKIDLGTILFSILLIGFLPIATYRVDYQHALMLAWPAYILWVHLCSRPFSTRILEKLFFFTPFLGVAVLTGFSLRGGNHFYLLMFSVLFFIVFVKYFSLLKGITSDLSDFIIPLFIVVYSVFSFQYSDSIFNELKTKSDWERVTPEVRWAATKVKLSNSSCLFDFTNQGLIAGLTLLPNCSEYAYPIYAPRTDDKQLKQALIENLPNTIVLSSTFWSYWIDGKTMASRYPLTAAYLADRYSSRECFKGICVANLN